MSTSENFEKAANVIKNISTTDDQKRILYGLYKQAREGDCNTTQPSMFNYIENEKWKSWNANKGISKNTAMEKYINYVNSIIL
jgi:diazepam-binding inhibitor (GABA receptor modulating acyl-CoA-binding protein)